MPYNRLGLGKQVLLRSLSLELFGISKLWTENTVELAMRATLEKSGVRTMDQVLV